MNMSILTLQLFSLLQLLLSSGHVVSAASRKRELVDNLSTAGATQTGQPPDLFLPRLVANGKETPCLRRVCAESINLVCMHTGILAISQSRQTTRTCNGRRKTRDPIKCPYQYCIVYSPESCDVRTIQLPGGGLMSADLLYSVCIHLVHPRASSPCYEVSLTAALCANSAEGPLWCRARYW